MIYSSSFVKNYVDPKQYTVHLLEDVNATEIETYITKGYNVVFSNADVWNFEGPAPSWVSQAQTYKRNIPRPSWKQVYENSPLDMLTGLGVQNARRRSDVPREQGVVVPSDRFLEVKPWYIAMRQMQRVYRPLYGHVGLLLLNVCGLTQSPLLPRLTELKAV